MSYQRVDRLSEEVQKEVDDIIRHSLSDPRIDGTYSVTRVEVTRDLRYAKVFVSTLDKEREKDLIRGLKSAAGYLRRELGAAIRLRYTPELQFVADDSIEYGAHILEMLRDPNVVKPANPANADIVLEDGD